MLKHTVIANILVARLFYGSIKMLSCYLTAYYSDGIFPIEWKYPIGRSFNQCYCKKINMWQDMFLFRSHSGLWIQLHFRASNRHAHAIVWNITGTQFDVRIAHALHAIMTLSLQLLFPAFLINQRVYNVTWNSNGTEFAFEPKLKPCFEHSTPFE